ncbi:hypothetical protein [Streptomyces antarcticus]|nr:MULTISPECIES: hypothetical protein [unclassified Streptomyces]MCY0942496.1 hypothetical protein [Streptomyces sp. H34-AA3]MCZ4083813.1 hypothetical protein [Streptomyces sp. H34-S5]
MAARTKLLELAPGEVVLLDGVEWAITHPSATEALVLKVSV